jgi:hypothetical protein
MKHYLPKTSAGVACWIAGIVLVLPFLVPARIFPSGFNVFLAWAILCVAAVLADRLIVWALLWILPLALVSWDWLQGPRQDSFGFYPWGEISLFSGMTIVVAATCVLSIVRATSRSTEKR